MKCQELQIWDWITDGHGFPMQITNVGDDYAYATFEGNEGDPWEYDDKNYKPCGITLTGEILKKNGFEALDDKGIWDNSGEVRCSYSKRVGDGFIIHTIDIEEYEEFGQFTFGVDSCLWQGVTINYIHELQHALRLAGFNDLADNFKV